MARAGLAITGTKVTSPNKKPKVEPGKKPALEVKKPPKENSKSSRKVQ